jgi:hypothetical protein
LALAEDEVAHLGWREFGSHNFHHHKSEALIHEHDAAGIISNLQIGRRIRVRLRVVFDAHLGRALAEVVAGTSDGIGRWIFLTLDKVASSECSHAKR